MATKDVNSYFGDYKINLINGINRDCKVCPKDQCYFVHSWFDKIPYSKAMKQFLVSRTCDFIRNNVHTDNVVVFDAFVNKVTDYLMQYMKNNSQNTADLGTVREALRTSIYKSINYYNQRQKTRKNKPQKTNATKKQGDGISGEIKDIFNELNTYKRFLGITHRGTHHRGARGSI